MRTLSLTRCHSATSQAIYPSPPYRSLPHSLLLYPLFILSHPIHPIPSSIFSLSDNSICTRKHMHLCLFCPTLLLLSTYFHDPFQCGESDLPACGPPAIFSVHLASSAFTPAGFIHKSRGDNVVRMWVQLKR